MLSFHPTRNGQTSSWKVPLHSQPCSYNLWQGIQLNPTTFNAFHSSLPHRSQGRSFCFPSGERIASHCELNSIFTSACLSWLDFISFFYFNRIVIVYRAAIKPQVNLIVN